MKHLLPAGIVSVVFFVASIAEAGRWRQEYVDGCQSVDGRYVVTAELVGGNPKDPKAGKWTFRWTDTKTKQTHAGDLVGLPPVGPFAHMFLAPDGERFAVWSPFTYCPGSPPPIGKLGNGAKLAEGTEKDWADHAALAHRLVIYRKTGDIVKTFAVKDLLNPSEMGEVRNVFQSLRWLTEYPDLTFGSAPRVGYGTYRISPDYTVIEFKTPKVGKDQGARLVRVDLTTGKLLDSAVALGEAKTPVRPFQGPDRITQDEQYLWQPSIDPVRVAGALKKTSLADDAVFQYTTTAPTKKGMTTAYLWVPPQAKTIRGVVLGGMTLAERELARDPIIRKACADEQLAVVFVRSGLASFDVQALMDELAKASGYRELSVVPLFFVGHSAGGPQAKALAATFADRCFGLMQYRGGAPSWDPPVPPGIPSLMMLGQFDEFGKAMMRDENGRENWENGRDEMIKYRGLDPNNLGKIVIEPGGGHYAWSDRNAAYLALYLRKAAKARIPEITGNETSPIKCKPIDVASGWLTDLVIKAAGHAPAPYGKYTGDKARAGWHFDRELAEATVAYHKGITKKDQFILWSNPGVDESAQRFYFDPLKWVGDGQTFEVNPVYAERYRKTPKTGTGPRWPMPGEPVGHSNAPILVRAVGGPYVAVGPNRFRIKFNALSPATSSDRGTFLAFSEGDADYRYTEVVGMTPRNFAGITSGKEQTITFSPIGDVVVDAAPVALKATSDSGLPVEFYVASGPAIIENGSLKLADIPSRAAFPLEVRVVAYQFGRGVEPTVKAATPVEQIVRVVRP